MTFKETEQELGKLEAWMSETLKTLSQKFFQLKYILAFCRYLVSKNILNE